MKPDERYTWRACADGYTDTGLRKGITEGDAICQLADYEDTGLSPEEVKLFMRGTLKPREKQEEIHRALYVGGTHRRNTAQCALITPHWKSGMRKIHKKRG